MDRSYIDPLYLQSFLEEHEPEIWGQIKKNAEPEALS